MTSWLNLPSTDAPARARRWALLWALVCLALLVILLALLPRAKINSSVLALLPKQTLGAIPPELHDGFMQRLDRQLVWLVSPGQNADPKVAQAWLEQLQKTPALVNVEGPMNQASQQAWGAFFWQHRNALIDDATRNRLQHGGQAQAQWILAQLYSAFAGVSGKEIKADPLLLTRGAQLALTANQQRLRLLNGWLVTQDAAGNYWYFVHAELAHNAFEVQPTQQLASHLATLKQKLLNQYPQAQLLARGTLFYSDYASRQAQHDMSTLGLASVLGVLGLIVLVFRSVRPLLLCLLSIGVGALAGTTAVLLVFGELHLMTLLMSLSIIGISADYSLYYLTERMVHGAQVTPWQSLAKVRAALLLALLTTVAAYLVMLLAPFPGIRQLALFAAVGLSASFLSVIFWQPWLCRGLPLRAVPLAPVLLRWLALWRRNKLLIIGLPLLLALATLLALANLRIDDDIAQLQALPQTLLQQEQAITRLTGSGVDQKWFVVYGATPEQTLQRMETLAPKLEQARKQGYLDSYRLLPLNSLARQQQDLELLRQAAPNIERTLRHAGIGNVKANLDATPVSVENWLVSPASAGWRLLWLTLPSGASGVLIAAGGVHNSAALEALAAQQPGVAWVDRKQAFDTLFAHYRKLLGGLLALALLMVAGASLQRLGLRQGVISLLPSLLSLGCALAALVLFGRALNLFSLLALLLVLGIGINYTLFFGNPLGAPLTSLLAVTLAMLTTLLTLGVLALSATPAISSFGIVLVSGIFSAWLLAPLALPNKKRKNQT